MTNSYPYKNWMSTTSSIDKLTLLELVWPGAHNSGVDYDFSYPIHVQPASHWFVCQDGPFIQQLNEGVRALDLRFHSDEHWLGVKKFHTFHGFKLLRGRSLSELFKSLDFFLSENPDEFVVLDMRELKGLDEKSFDYTGFHEAIMSELSTRLIPRENRYLTLGALKKINPLQRIVVAADWHPDFNSPLYWPKIPVEWSGNDITSPEELRQHIERTLNNPPEENTLWSLSATSYGELAGVTRITRELNEWFAPDTGWAQKCSIISADFIGATRLVSYCREINLSRGQSKK